MTSLSRASGLPVATSFRGYLMLAVLSTALAGVPILAADNTVVLATARVPGWERLMAVPAPRTAPAEEEDEEDVVPPEFSDEAQQRVRGRVLLSELGCVACHQADDVAGQAAKKQAPVLTNVGARVKPAWLLEYLQQPQHAKPGSTMPDLLARFGEAKRREVAEDLTHFLSGTGRPMAGRRSGRAAERGAELFRSIGCAACHTPPGETTTDLKTSAPLPDLGKKYTLGSLKAFLLEPHQARPSGRMPRVVNNDEEAAEIAHYFSRDEEFGENLAYEVGYGSFSSLPDWQTLKVEKQGTCGGFDLSVAERGDNYLLRFTGYFQATQDGSYRFQLGSDDGSRLLVDGEEVVKNDGIHPHQFAEGRIELKAGWHRVVIDYFQGGGEASLEAGVSGPGLGQQSLDALLSLTKEPPKAQPGEFQRDAQRATRGQKYFVELGCIRCHEMTIDPAPNPPTAPALKSLAANKGCLADAPTAAVPHYALSDAQRSDLRAALAASAEPESTAEVVHRSLATFNCYACHQRGQQGGVEATRNEFFQSTMKEMGDEGRLPPTLTGVGDKLRDDWMNELFTHGTNDRQSYMQTRMPRFGGDNVRHLIGAFVELDRKPDPAPEVVFAEPEARIKSAGRQLVGGQALSCIKCHNFAEHPATGIQAINLVSMTRRLRHEWFHRYLLNPQEYRPGTRMPAAWPFGKSTIPTVLHGDTTKQIEAVWRYLADGDRAAVPAGLVREPIELVPSSTPILYRNFIQGAGPRAIGVGYPEKVNLAWDANDLRLALSWHGAFIDASRHWNGRGVGFEAPLGDHVLAFPGGQPLALLGSSSEAWPAASSREAGGKFRGYSLNAAQQPTFQYQLHGLLVDDVLTPAPVPGTDSGLERLLTLQGAGAASAWHRLATGRDIKPVDSPSGSQSFSVDGSSTIELLTGREAIIRESGGQLELLVQPEPGPHDSGTIRYRLTW